MHLKIKSVFLRLYVIICAGALKGTVSLHFITRENLEIHTSCTVPTKLLESICLFPYFLSFLKFCPFKQYLVKWICASFLLGQQPHQSWNCMQPSCIQMSLAIFSFTACHGSYVGFSFLLGFKWFWPQSQTWCHLKKKKRLVF